MTALREAHPAVRSRYLGELLKASGVKEPEEEHIALAEALVFSGNPSARASFPGGVTLTRSYDTLQVLTGDHKLERVMLSCPGTLELENLRVTCMPADTIVQTQDAITIHPRGTVFLRCRESGDAIRLTGGTKSLKKLFIDRKIPAFQRQRIPVLSDDGGVLGVYGIGVNLDRIPAQLPAVQIRIEPLET